MLKTGLFSFSLSCLALAALAAPASARHGPFLAWPSAIVFQPYHPWKDGAIAFPAPQGPVPVHVRIYSTPMQPPYYNVPRYIVLDP
jgi:hypothetical protein